MRPLYLSVLLFHCSNAGTPVPPSPSRNAQATSVKENPAPSVSISGALATPPATASPGAAGAHSTATTPSVVTPVVTATPAAPPGMARVPGGEFTMGANEGGQEDERPAHIVRLEDFYLDVTEVTHTAYDVCVAAKKCNPPDAKTLGNHAALFVTPQRPVTGISWDDARAYCAFVGKRLPREAEFERAVRGSDGRKYPWGDEAPTHERTVFQVSKTEDVGTHPLGRGPYGHDDLAGNVWEWMEDAYDPIAYRRDGAAEGKPGTCEQIIAFQNQLRAEGREGFTGSNPIPTECERSIRGGAYNYDAHGLRSTNRVHHPGRYHLLMTGVRCAKSL